jgi:hypothetical protein
MSNSVPRAVQVQLARLFGEASAEASAQTRTPAQWRRTLKRTLDELYQYSQANVTTDEMHWFMICTAFAAAAESLKEEDFWPGYVEGLVRLNLLLLGDYPDHRSRKGGKKREDHYRLNQFRNVIFAQDNDQRRRVIHAAPRFGFPTLSVSPRDLMTEYVSQFGHDAARKGFMRWFKAVHPQDYAKLF